ncbi:hypothetical protein PRIPAC_82553 [Pristionchus pacificus]|uniref:Uncharacterized protein n=1 Tax=Pristionchus pacificus TaxID=54126 RepID=A0A2A6CBK2_PRIPA|nr:hypothetical protein PRIPAC_82553 [Pristionchus pacificus]|eukprot:PDM75554.1 hypothetical protein PRIPAC_42731 [Pristionchus pacificus]
MVFNQLYYRCSKEEQSPRLFSKFHCEMLCWIDD